MVTATAADRLRDVLATAGHDGEIAGERLSVTINGADPRALAVAVNRAAGTSGIVLAELSTSRTSLEDRYLSMVTEGGDR